MILLGDASMKRLDNLSFQTGAARNCHIKDGGEGFESSPLMISVTPCFGGDPSSGGFSGSAFLAGLVETFMRSVSSKLLIALRKSSGASLHFMRTR